MPSFLGPQVVGRLAATVTVFFVVGGLALACGSDPDPAGSGDGAVDSGGPLDGAAGDAASRDGGASESGVGDGGARDGAVADGAAGDGGDAAASPLRSLSVGAFQACTIDEAGTLRCWGDGYGTATGQGSLGTAVPAPVVVASGQAFREVSTNGISRCAIRDDGTLWCRIGVGTALAQFGSEKWAHFSDGGPFWCGIKAAGTLECFFDGPGSVPKALTDPSSWASVQAGGDHVCGIKSDGSLWCWGHNESGQLGIGAGPNTIVPTAVGTARDWLMVAAGDTSSTCALRAPGSLWCWGAPLTGGAASGSAPVQVGVGTDWRAIDVGFGSACGITTAGALYCWGGNAEGQLGDGTRTARATPTRVGSDADWALVDVGRDHACATKTNGTTFCWGNNREGQLGYGVAGDKLLPGRIGTEVGWSSVSVNDDEACAVKDGAVLCWGQDPENAKEILLPTKQGTGTSYSSVALGPSHKCAIDATGGLFCWGSSGSGKLGIGPPATSYIATPTAVGPATGWSSVAPGTSHTCARRSGEISCWGSAGALGLGPTVNQDTPQVVGSLTDWSAVASGNGATCAVRGGDLHCWGFGYSDLPTVLDASGTWTGVSVEKSGVALRTDGTIWSWAFGDAPAKIGLESGWSKIVLGSLSYGALKKDGRIFTSNSTTAAPTALGADSDWSELALRQSYGCAIKTNGALYCWGKNDSGQHGDDSVRRLVPTPTKL